MGGAACWRAGPGAWGRRIVAALGLALLAAGGAAAAAGLGWFPLYLFTVLLGLGITLAQTSVPVLRAPVVPPPGIGLVARASSADGLILGETLGASPPCP